MLLLLIKPVFRKHLLNVLQRLTPFPEVGNVSLHQIPESGGVIHMYGVAKLVDDDVIYELRVGGYEHSGKVYGSLRRAWTSVYADLTWEENWCESHSNYDYDRFRGTVGLRFHY